MLTKYERIGETARWETLPNGLPVCIVPKRDFSGNMRCLPPDTAAWT